ncbi:MAG: flagellar hook capping FlgD N-terminal domain-containing protein [Sporolactobacillus sp.]
MDTNVDATPRTSGTTTNSSSASKTGTTALDKDSFLKLLVAQLTHQDPTSPMDSGQFVSQMADFTTLEQTQNMSDAINKLVQTQSDSSLSAEADMIGKKITWDDTETGSDGKQSTTSKTGVVQAVAAKDGSVSYVTADGDTVDPSTVTQIQTN